MSSYPEAVNFGTGPSPKLTYWEKFKIVMNPYQDTFTMKKTIIAVIAEFLLTAIFVFYCSTTVIAGNYTDSGLNLVVGLGQGFALALAIYIAAPASGGHLNPAVTLSVLCVGRINFLRAMLYIVAQFTGAMCGAGLARACIREQFRSSLGATMVNPDISLGGAWGLECIMTFMLVFVMFSTAIDPRGVGKLAPLAIGLAVLIDNLIGANWTGASMNPARTLGPQLVSGDWDHYWLYFTAPLAGALLAAVTYVLYLKIDPINEAVDQNNQIIRQRVAIHNIDKAPQEYKPKSHKKTGGVRNLWRRSVDRTHHILKRNASDTQVGNVFYSQDNFTGQPLYKLQKFDPFTTPGIDTPIPFPNPNPIPPPPFPPS